MVIVTLIVPFILLAYWNVNTLAVMIRRRRLKNRPALTSNNTLRTVCESPETINRDVAAALLNVANVMQANPVACSASRQGILNLISGGILVIPKI